MSQPTTIPPRFVSPSRTAKRRFTKNTLLGRPLRRKDSGTAATNFRGRQRLKRRRLRKLQRQARRNQR
jgi:hypothetical protein